jgi:hypothetical protein
MSSKIAFDEESRAFVRRIQARKPLPPPPELHKKLSEHTFTATINDSGEEVRVTVSEQELRSQGWRRG